MLVHRRITPSIKLACTHLYAWVERGTVRVKCLAQEHNIMSPARARTRTARPGDKRFNHEATTPPQNRELFIYAIKLVCSVLDYSLSISMRDRRLWLRPRQLSRDRNLELII